MMTKSQNRAFASCDLLADYSQAGGEPVLPYLMTLDLTASRLAPAAGETQRFCYDVTGVGSAGPEYADLTQLVLGICDAIPPQEIASLTVIVNGEEQEVDFGPAGNVALRTAEDPDPVSGCTGLAVYFPLEREDSQLQLCFELTAARPVGPTAVCLSGGGVTRSGLSVCGPACAEPEPEESLTVYYRADIAAPVSIVPAVELGEAQVTACGEPELALNGDRGDGGACGFTLRQRLCLALPVSLTLTAAAEPAVTEGQSVSLTDDCAGCGGEEPPAEQGVISRPSYCG